MRENLTETEGSGLVIGTEWEPEKVTVARENLTRAGLGDIVDIREGDIRDTLSEIEGGIDFVLMDIWAPMARPALDLLMPKLKPGALLFCDNVGRFRRDYRDYLERVRDPATGFMSTALPGGGGVEVEWVRGYAHDAAGFEGSFDKAVSSLLFHQVIRGTKERESRRC